jgi:hypothetical protein
MRLERVGDEAGGRSDSAMTFWRDAADSSPREPPCNGELEQRGEIRIENVDHVARGCSRGLARHGSRSASAQPTVHFRLMSPQDLGRFARTVSDPNLSFRRAARLGVPRQCRSFPAAAWGPPRRPAHRAESGEDLLLRLSGGLHAIDCPAEWETDLPCVSSTSHDPSIGRTRSSNRAQWWCLGNRRVCHRNSRAR